MRFKVSTEYIDKDKRMNSAATHASDIDGCPGRTVGSVRDGWIAMGRGRSAYSIWFRPGGMRRDGVLPWSKISHGKQAVSYLHEPLRWERCGETPPRQMPQHAAPTHPKTQLISRVDADCEGSCARRGGRHW